MLPAETVFFDDTGEESADDDTVLESLDTGKQVAGVDGDASARSMENRCLVVSDTSSKVAEFSGDFKRAVLRSDTELSEFFSCNREDDLVRGGVKGNISCGEEERKCSRLPW